MYIYGYDIKLCNYVIISVQGEQDYLLALSRPLLSLSSPTRGKYSLLASLVPHISVNEVLMEWPNLPYEIMDTMGHQMLACKVGVV